MQVRGFTLLEMLVAVSIFAIIGVMGFSGLIEVGRSGEQVTDAQRQLSEIQFAFRYIGRDLAQLSPRKIRNQYGDEEHQLVLNEDKITFTRAGWSNLLQQPRSSLQRVEYQVQDENLYRSYWPVLDQGFSDTRINQVLLPNVNSISVNLLTQDTKKLDTWPDTTQTSSSVQPVAVEVVLDIKGIGEIIRIFEVSSAVI